MILRCCFTHLGQRQAHQEGSPCLTQFLVVRFVLHVDTGIISCSYHHVSYHVTSSGLVSYHMFTDIQLKCKAYHPQEGFIMISSYSVIMLSQIWVAQLSQRYLSPPDREGCGCLGLEPGGQRPALRWSRIHLWPYQLPPGATCHHPNLSSFFAL